MTSKTTSGHSRPLLSIVIPIAPDDFAWKGLLGLLTSAPDGTEVILSSTGLTPLRDVPERTNLKIICTEGPRGRAGQMNRAAALATGEFLWFLHADSRFASEAIEALLIGIKEHPDAFHYFRLKFSTTSEIPIGLNAIGANLRSRFLKMPFGDQGYCLKRDLFFKLGGYSETAVYGEDHLLVWAARHNRVSIRELPVTLTTSARKYEMRGWGHTTRLHVWLTIKQATPQFIKLLKGYL